MFLVQGQLLAGSGPSLVGLSAGLLADPERVGRYIASITDQEPGMNGHHLDPQVAGDSHIFDLFRRSRFLPQPRLEGLFWLTI